MPNLVASTGSSMFSSGSRYDGGQPVTLMPACYASHKAMHAVYEKNPGLFQGQGKPENRTSENFWPATFRHTAVTALAYQRRQTLLPEVEYLHRTKKSDGFLRHPISREWNKDAGLSSGAPFE